MSETGTEGMQVRVAVEAADACPVAAAATGEASAESATWTRASDGDVVEEFELVGDVDDAALPDDAETVFDTGDRRRVRFERGGADCICDRIEGYGVPVTDVDASDGTLRVSFHTTDVETVQDVVADLSAAFESARIDRLAHTDGNDDEDLVVVDRGRLTDRQVEVLDTAREMGYFDRPRDANATEVADALDISPSTFAEHLAAAQSKLLDSVLDD